MAWSGPPPLDPPPADIIAAYRAYLAANARADAAAARWPAPQPAGAWHIPVTDELRALTQHTATEAYYAGLKVWQHPWYWTAQNRAEADRLLDAAVAAGPGHDEAAPPDG